MDRSHQERWECTLPSSSSSSTTSFSFTSSFFSSSSSFLCRSRCPPWQPRSQLSRRLSLSVSPFSLRLKCPISSCSAFPLSLSRYLLSIILLFILSFIFFVVSVSSFRFLCFFAHLCLANPFSSSSSSFCCWSSLSFHLSRPFFVNCFRYLFLFISQSLQANKQKEFPIVEELAQDIFMYLFSFFFFIVFFSSFSSSSSSSSSAAAPPQQVLPPLPLPLTPLSSFLFFLLRSLFFLYILYLGMLSLLSLFPLL